MTRGQEKRDVMGVRCSYPVASMHIGTKTGSLNVWATDVFMDHGLVLLKLSTLER